MIVCSCNVISDNDVRGAIAPARRRRASARCSAISAARPMRTLRAQHLTFVEATFGSGLDEMAETAILRLPREERAHVAGKGELMRGDAKVIDYLNRGVRAELTAINQILAALPAFRQLGFSRTRQKWRHESIEEMEHADKFVKRVLFLEGFPKMQSHVIRCASARASRRSSSSISKPRWRRPQALSEAAGLLPLRQRPRVGRTVPPCRRERGAPHRLPRNAAGADQAARRAASTRKSTSRLESS